MGLDQVKDTSPLGEVKVGRSKITREILEQAAAWFSNRIESVRLATTDYQKLLNEL